MVNALGERGRGPGSAWALLRDEVVHLDPQAAVWTAMCRGWEIQQQSRMLSRTTIDSRLKAVDRFFQFVGTYPWEWQPSDVEEWTVVLRSQKWAFSTVRAYQGAVAMFCDYLVDPRYGWGEACFEQFGAHPAQVFHEWNIARHTSEFEANPSVRPFTRSELQRLFDFADQQVERAVASGRKGSLAAFRDAVMLKTCYAYGLRRAELVGLALSDFYTNASSPEFGARGSCLVRYGKAAKGSPPRRRTVLTVMPWIVGVLEEYVTRVRPLYEVGQRTMMFPTERGGKVSASYLEARFRQYREASGLPAELRLHGLRHSYVTHLIEDGWDAYFVQRQVGHAWASTTSIYAGVSSDFMNTTLRAALDRSAPGLLESAPSMVGVAGEATEGKGMA